MQFPCRAPALLELLARAMSAALLAFAALVVPARAGWQQTEWGMSVEQVLEAVPGAVRLAHNEGSRSALNLRVEAPYLALGWPTTARFLFANPDPAWRQHPEDQGLAEVSLWTEHPGACVFVLPALIDVYGPPDLLGDDISRLPADLIPRAMWFPVGEAHVVKYVEQRRDDGSFTNCVVSYERRRAAGIPGGL